MTSNPAFSPDGTRIAFEANGQKNIDTVTLPGGALMVVAAAIGIVIYILDLIFKS